ncbi:MAG: acyl-CoA thioesterase [candidate division NC10 bacterium]|nr:acyl-CoA thioesterase [candidate division NC10 bacterium]
MKPAGFRFACPIRVRYSEVDGQGIVYNSRYLEYVDVALTEYFRALGFQYQEMVEQHGFDPSLVKATLEFKRPARFDEVLLVHARVVAIGRASFSMDYEIVREEGGEQVASAQIIYANFDKTTQGSRPVPDAIRRRIEAFEGTVFPSPT